MTMGEDHISGTGPDPHDANEAIRAFVAGRTVWTPEALAELDRLRTEWRSAGTQGLDTPA